MIRIGITILLSLLCLISEARTPDLEGRFYNPVKNIDDIYLELETSSFKTLTKQDSLKAKIYILKSKIGVDLVDIDLSKVIKEKIIEQIKFKMRLLVGFDFNTWISPYSFIEEKNNIFYYEDSSGLLENKKIKLEIKEKSIILTEYSYSGETSTEYTYKLNEWSKGLLVLDSITKVKEEYSDKIQTVTTFKYTKIDNLWLQNEIIINVKQTISEKLTQKIERDFIEIYLLKNVATQKGFAKKWFEK